MNAIILRKIQKRNKKAFSNGHLSGGPLFGFGIHYLCPMQNTDHYKLELIEMEMGGCLLFAEALAGDEKYRLMLDSGANRSFVHRAASVDEAKDDKQRTASGIGQSPDLQMTRLEEVSLNGMELADYYLFVKPLDGLNAMIAPFKDIMVHGFLGGDILNALKAVIHFEGRILELAGKQFDLDIIHYPGNMLHYLLEMNWNGTVLNLIVDTGASHSLLDKETMEGIFEGIDKKWETVDVPVAGMGQHAPAKSSEPINGLQWGKLNLSGHQFLGLDFEHVHQLFKKEGKEGPDIIIGNDILGTFADGIDYRLQSIKLITE